MIDFPRATVLIDIAAYRNNLARLSEALRPAALMAVVKSDAYGHGLLPLARAAVEEGITQIGALDIETGLSLRSAGIPRSVAILAWLHTPDDDFAAAIDAGIDLGVSTVEELRVIATAGASERARIHLKIDTGLHRNGADARDWPELVRSAVAAEAAGIVDLYGVWTHISEASDDEDSLAIARFDEAITVAESLGARFSVRHLAASAAGFAREDSRFDLVRMGAFTLGISPGSGVTAAELGLTPVMTLSSQVDSVQRVDGQTVAVVPIGYGDGILGECADRVEVTIRGKRHTVAHVHLDRITVPIDDGDAELGDPVILFGPGTQGEATLQEWADSLGTIGEELVVRLDTRLPRRYLT